MAKGKSKTGDSNTETGKGDKEGKEELTFASFNLEDRLARGVRKLKFEQPTLIQEKCIPFALQGKDILARARTGSGKTAAYSIPLVQKLLTQSQSTITGVRGLVLVPTRELVTQVTEHIVKLTKYCNDILRVVGLTGDVPMESQRPRLAEDPAIIISTPARLLRHLDAGNITLKDTLDTLVIDEADLILSYGYEDDMRTLASHLPSICQTLMMSATLSPKVEGLKSLLLKRPVVLKLESGDEGASNLTHFSLRCQEKDKHLILYALFKLRLVSGKCLIFVADVDSCFRLKLFLDQFSIKAAVLNPELPFNSRHHIISEFNKGLFDFVIATDESDAAPKIMEKKDEDDDASDSEDDSDNDGKRKKGAHPETKAAKRHKRKQQQKAEYSAARGIDFKNVSTVVNLDFPRTYEAYAHRVGRTARGLARGTALSLVGEADQEYLQMVEDTQKELYGESAMRAYAFKMEEIEGFRYRVDDIMRTVTRHSIKQARVAELRSEILNSEKLKAHFEDNPQDLEMLRHERAINPNEVKPHLKTLPQYLLPKSVTSSKIETAVHERSRRGGRGGGGRGGGRGGSRDPLKSFRAGGGRGRRGGRGGGRS